MIGWENNQGAYFINKLQNEVDDVKETADDNEEAIGTLSDLTTTSKTTLVGAINEVDSNADSANTAIGSLANLITTDKTDIVSAINEVEELATKLDTKIVSFGNVAGGKQITFTNTGSTHIVMVVFGGSVETSLKCAFLGTLSGSSSGSRIADLTTAGTNTTVSSSGKTITIQNKSGSSNLAVRAIIFNNMSSLSYEIADIPT